MNLKYNMVEYILYSLNDVTLRRIENGITTLYKIYMYAIPRVLQC